MPARSGGWGDDVWAALAGALEGGFRGYQYSKDLEAQERRRREEEEYRRQMLEERRLAADEARAARKHQRQRQEQTDAGQQLDAMRETFGSGRMLPAEADTVAQTARRSWELTPGIVDQVVTPTVPGGPAALPVMGGRMFRQSAAERTAQQRADELARALETAPAPVRQAVELGSATGKVPTIGADAFVPAEDPAVAEQRKFEGWRRQQDYREQQIRSRPPRRASSPTAPKDDPRFPKGVRDYLNSFATRYRGNPQGAVDELEAALADLLRDHPRLDVGAARAHVRDLVGAPPKPDEGDSLSARLGGPPVARTAAGAPPVKPAAAASPGLPPASAAPPAAKPTVQPGQRVRLKDGRVVTIKAVNPDGTFEFQ